METFVKTFSSSVTSSHAIEHGSTCVWPADTGDVTEPLPEHQTQKELSVAVSRSVPAVSITHKTAGCDAL